MPNISRRPDGLRRREAERPDHLLLGQAEQLAARRRGAEHARRAGDVPAAIVMRGIDGVADAALHFDAENERVQELPPDTGRRSASARIAEATGPPG